MTKQSDQSTVQHNTIRAGDEVLYKGKKRTVYRVFLGRVIFTDGTSVRPL